MKKQLLLFALLIILLLVLPGAYEKIEEYLRRQTVDSAVPFSVPSRKKPPKPDLQVPAQHGFTMPFDARLDSALAFIKNIEAGVNAASGEKKYYGMNDLKAFCASGEDDPEVFLAILNNRYGVSDFCRGWAAVALGYLNNTGSYTDALISAYKSETSNSVRIAVLYGFLKEKDAHDSKTPLISLLNLAIDGIAPDNISFGAVDCFMSEIDALKNSKNETASYLIRTIAPVQRNFSDVTFKLLGILQDKNSFKTIREAAAAALAYSQPGIATIDLEQIILKNSSAGIDPQFNPADNFHEAVLAAQALAKKAVAGDEMAAIECRKLLADDLSYAVKKELIQFCSTGDTKIENLPVLLGLLRSDSIEVKKEALFLLYSAHGLSDDWEPIIRDAVYDAIRKETRPVNKAELIQVITNDVFGTPNTADDHRFLMELLIGNESDEVKKQVIMTLVVSRAVEAGTYIEDIAKNSTSANLRETAEEALYYLSEYDSDSELYDRYGEMKKNIMFMSVNKDIDGIRVIFNEAPVFIREFTIRAMTAEDPGQESFLTEIAANSDNIRLRSRAIEELLGYSKQPGTIEKTGRLISGILLSPDTSDVLITGIIDAVPGMEVTYEDGRILSDTRYDRSISAPDGNRLVDSSLMDAFLRILRGDSSADAKKAVLGAFKKIHADAGSAGAISEELQGMLEDESFSELKPDIRKALNWLKYNSEQ